MSQANTQTIRVLLVDDHDMLRSGIAVVLSDIPDFELVGSAPSGTQAVALCEQHRPDVVLMDILMPDMDGLAAARIIRSRFPEIRIVVLSSFEEEPLVQSAREIGISGYLLKNVSIDELVGAMRDAYEGKPGHFPK